MTPPCSAFATVANPITDTPNRIAVANCQPGRRHSGTAPSLPTARPKAEHMRSTKPGANAANSISSATNAVHE